MNRPNLILEKFNSPFNVEKETIENTYYRHVMRTTHYAQYVLMSINPGEDVPWEVHPNTTQFIRVESGRGYLQLRTAENKHSLNPDGHSGKLIVEGTKHRIYVPKSEREPLKIYTIYSGEILHEPDLIEERQSDSQ